MKKRAVAILLAVVFLSTLCNVCFADGYAFIMTAQSDSYNVSKGETFYVTFYANSISDSSGILALDANIVYDPSHIKLQSVQPLVPERWGTGIFAAYPEVSKNGKKYIEYKLVFDGNSITESTGVTEDDVLGVKLGFLVETSSKTNTTVEMPTELLEGTTAPPNVGTVSGLGDSYTFSLNSSPATEQSSEQVSEIVSSDDNTSESNVNSEENIISDESTDSESFVSEAVSETSNEDSEAPTSGDVNTSAEISSDATSEEGTGDNSVSSESSSTSNNSDDDGVNVVLWIVIACAAFAIIAVIVYMVKNKKDDMNPVNPG